MVDFTKRAAKAAAEHLAATETVLAGVNVMPAPLVMGSGAIAGGLVGAAIGAAVDKRRERKQEEDSAGSLPEIAGRPVAADAIPKNGALLGVTDLRLLVWQISGLGKPKGVLFQVPLDRIESVAWHEADTKWLRGSPKSTLIWFGLTDGTVIPAAAISLGPAAKYVDAVVHALAQRLPGKVSEFTG